MSVNSFDAEDDARVERDHGYQSSNRTKPAYSPPTAAHGSGTHEGSARDERTQGGSVHKRASSAAKNLNGRNGKHLGLRLLRVVILALCYFVLEVVAKTITVLQFAFVAWKKRPHGGMQRLGAMIAEYMQDLWRYFTFASDDAPWPFRRWPRRGVQVRRQT